MLEIWNDKKCKLSLSFTDIIRCFINGWEYFNNNLTAHSIMERGLILFRFRYSDYHFYKIYQIMYSLSEENRMLVNANQQRWVCYIHVWKRRWKQPIFSPLLQYDASQVKYNCWERRKADAENWEIAVQIWSVKAKRSWIGVMNITVPYSLSSQKCQFKCVRLFKKWLKTFINGEKSYFHLIIDLNCKFILLLWFQQKEETRYGHQKRNCVFWQRIKSIL